MSLAHGTTIPRMEKGTMMTKGREKRRGVKSLERTGTTQREAIRMTLTGNPKRRTNRVAKNRFVYTEAMKGMDRDFLRNELE
jgi:hypothetical protein